MTLPAFTTLRLEPRGPRVDVVLARPNVHNAFDATLIRELTQVFEAIASMPAVRVVVLTGEGRSFCAGADLNWMREMAHYDREQNLSDARALARMLDTIDTCPRAVIARVNGAVRGGGCGLVACADVVLAVERASFAFTEVNLGLVPATIAPYVQAKIGTSAARRYFVTGERFDAPEARRIGLVHEVCEEASIDERVDELVAELMGSAPEAVGRCKDLVGEISIRVRPEVNEFTARLIAEVRGTAEAQEGMTAFLEKRSLPWATPDGAGDGDGSGD